MLVTLALGRLSSVRVSWAVVVALLAQLAVSGGVLMSLKQQVTCCSRTAQHSMLSFLSFIASGLLGQGSCPSAIIGLSSCRVDVPLQSDL